MRNRVVKYIVILGLLAFLGFKSVYFRKLDEVNSQSGVSNFDADAFARSFYKDKLPLAIDSAVDLNTLVSLLNKDPEAAVKRYAHALAIGNICYFLVRGEGTVARLTDTGVTVNATNATSKPVATIATEFIYGNAIRDASGLVQLSDFNNTAELNSVSESVNKIVRAEVIPPFVAKAKEGSAVQFVGAVELNKKYLELDTIEVVPVRLNVLN
ncbi:DUF2291 domain-containing protein [Chryseolinea sp. T2]|uniref:DUF2291 domain-containing protein n=1 Tax=Chryseolinea sp. T2 TaxID=3129255 RepID=UPI0030783671